MVRIRETTEQAGLRKSGRRKNVRGAFALTDKLPEKHIALIDDVVTTGSTVNELARVLKRAGAMRIEVWAAARAG
jgi:predicted amidophosphoribosyltransferase